MCVEERKDRSVSHNLLQTQDLVVVESSLLHAASACAQLGQIRQRPGVSSLCVYHQRVSHRYNTPTISQSPGGLANQQDRGEHRGSGYGRAAMCESTWFIDLLFTS